jgi:glycosyltransferase involved in cell wall biosynthesis
MLEKPEQNPREQNPPSLRSSPLHRGAIPKIAILHDAFLYRGGGERLVTLMANSLDADLISGFFSDGSFDPRELGFEGAMIALGKPVFAKGLRHAILKYRFSEKTHFLSQYDIVILSGNCLDAVKNIPKSTKKIYYCHTPPRYIFDFRERYMMRFPRWLHRIADILLDREARNYTRQLALMEHIFTNSENVHTRLLSFCGFDSEILYPPTDVSRFTPAICHSDEGRICSDFQEGKSRSFVPQDDKKILTDYFLSFARLSPPKRVDLIVDAFLTMPDQQLILTYGRNDPMRDDILARIRNSKNIQAIESPDDGELISLIQWATATIYIPVDEDFGMSPVESMACGTPVIGVDEGGLRETIVQNETGKLIAIQNSKLWIQNLKTIVQKTNKEEWEAMSDACVVRAWDFSLDAFEKKLKSSLQL